MNDTDADFFNTKFRQVDRKLCQLHDDVLVIKTERKMEKGIVAGLAGFVALITTIVVRIFWR